ncbi:MAG TPA: hypothetical protein VJR58_20265 [Vineibacter sp.]|nr:hypothetical protein [Vineibacter sp.]
MNIGSGFRNGRGLIAVLVLIAAAALALLGNWGGGSPADRGPGASGPQLEARGPQGQERVWGPAVGFASRNRLEEHYDKHGGEFGNISQQEYLRLAQALRDAPAGGSILESIRRDGVVTRFDRRSGAFIAFNPNGVIRTFFRPNDGERYFRRQLERDH